MKRKICLSSQKWLPFKEALNFLSILKERRAAVGSTSIRIEKSNPEHS